ncbi:MAG: arginine--tRNA ligase [Thermoplasmata archaeon]|nr:arginine--tRNA ligase [Thermoplasmata archaeon]
MATRSGDSGQEPSYDPWQPLLDPLRQELSRRLGPPGAATDLSAVDRLLDTNGGPNWELAFPLHRAAARLRTPAPELAKQWAADFPALEGLDSAFAAGPYLNFRADRAWLTERTLSLVRARGAQYGHRTPGPTRVCVEHTSANPNGPFHIGRVRNALLGDTLARVLRAAGFPVTTHYYVDDVGRQAAMLGWIWSKPVTSWPAEIRASLDGADRDREKPDRYLGRPYPPVNEYLKGHPEADAEVQAIAHELERGHVDPAYREIVQQVLDGMLLSLQEIGVSFDDFVWESDLIANGAVAAVVERLRHAPHAVQETNGAWAIDATGSGLPQESTRIIVTRGDGTTLYATRDVAYHRRKLAAFDRVIDVLGTNHELHSRVLRILLAEVGEPRLPEFVLYQYITAADGAGMSTRKGTAVYLDDLLEEAVHRARNAIRERHSDLSDAEKDAIATSVASGAIRYHILRVAADKTVAFRWEEALSFEGKSGPFLQYAYARAGSILRKSEVAPGSASVEPARLSTPEEWTLIRQMARLPGLLEYVARTAHVHGLATYAHELAEQFNRFYQQVPVLAEGPERESRIALVEAVHQALGNSLDLLGIARLDRM